MEENENKNKFRSGKRAPLKGEQRWQEWKRTHPRKGDEQKEIPVLHSKLLHDWVESGLGPDYELEWGKGTPIPHLGKSGKAKKG